MHQLERNLIVNADADKVWAFLATPVNLDRLTPPELRFRILSAVPDTMYDGLLIRYEIGIPLFGRWQWLTEIKHIEPGHSFVDEQRSGPYRFWYHYHAIEATGDGRTRMIDRVTYQLPFGPLGELVHALQVRRMLGDIFDYRAEKLKEIFP
ncbi:MAG: hypothetical protein D6794_12170 [Deltaproteobacteria bacterium]|nr:MAG: hypothetical protein D6794_12170 [Deltaproteobacteria bacterium]